MKQETQVDGLNKTTFIKDEMEKKIAVKEEQNINPHLKHNKELYNHNDGYSKSRAWKRVASVPTLALQIWAKEETGDNNWFRLPKETQNKILKKKLKAAAKKGGKLGQRARLAITLRKLSRNR